MIPNRPKHHIIWTPALKSYRVEILEFSEIVLLILNGFKRRLLIQLIIPYCSDLGRREKINLNFCFYTSLWCLKSLSEDLGGFHKAFCGPTKKCESKNLY